MRPSFTCNLGSRRASMCVRLAAELGAGESSVRRASRRKVAFASFASSIASDVVRMGPELEGSCNEEARSGTGEER